MTNKEAIEQLRERLAITDYRQQIPEYYEAIELAVEALEKQMPKKPNKLNCPHCSFNGIDNSWWVFDFCPKCGQAIDWSDEDD